jgi:hypothetical protein
MPSPATAPAHGGRTAGGQQPAVRSGEAPAPIPRTREPTDGRRSNRPSPRSSRFPACPPRCSESPAPRVDEAPTFIGSRQRGRPVGQCTSSPRLAHFGAAAALPAADEAEVRLAAPHATARRRAHRERCPAQPLRHDSSHRSLPGETIPATRAGQQSTAPFQFPTPQVVPPEEPRVPVPSPPERRSRRRRRRNPRSVHRSARHLRQQRRWPAACCPTVSPA